MKKRAQGGLNAAILVAIIAGLIILYMIFLPTSEREKLLDNKTKEISTELASNVLLQVFPGTLSVSRGLENEKTIPDIFLVETTNAVELKRVNPFIVRNGWFDKKIFKVDFELDDVDNTDNVILSFTAKKKQGVLSIKLNDVVVFENEMESSITEPIKLDKSLLKKSNNLEFSLASVGLKFWTTNEYSLENVKIIGDITDISKQESTNIFTLSEAEFQNMDKATLRFIPYCSNVNELGALDIFINNRKLFSTVPVCENSYKQSVPKSVLNEGENNVVFKTNKGSYSIEQTKISLEFKEPKVKTYYFEIASELFKEIKNQAQDVLMTIKFADDDKQKRAKLDINGHIETLETNKMLFSKNINNKVSEGNNFIRLEPFEDLEIVEIKIELI